MDEGMPRTFKNNFSEKMKACRARLKENGGVSHSFIMRGGAWPFFVGEVICLVNSVMIHVFLKQMKACCARLAIRK